MGKKNDGPNVNKLLELVGIFTLFPERQKQSTWFGNIKQNKTAADLKPGSKCGTTLCTAGWTAVLYGPKEAIFSPYEGDSFFTPNPFGEWFVTKDDVLEFEEYVAEGVAKSGLICDKTDIADFAQKELGLTSDQAFALFYLAENVEEVLAVIRKLISKPKATQDELLDARDKVRF